MRLATSAFPKSSSYHPDPSSNLVVQSSFIQEVSYRKRRENIGDYEQKFSDQVRSEKIRNRSREQLDQPAKRKSRSLPRVPKEDGEQSSRRIQKEAERIKKHSREGRLYSRSGKEEEPSNLRSSRDELNPRNSKEQTLKSVLSRSMHLLVVPREVEVPVVVDDVTKWIAGVSSVTTCSDIIDAILAKQNMKGKV